VIEWPIYSISRRTFKWMKKLFFHPLDLAILNSYILHSLCGCKKISCRYFRYILVRNTLAHAGPERPLGRPPNVESRVAMLKVCWGKHWPTQSEMQLRCRVCRGRGVTKKVFVKCRKCDMGLCARHVSKTTTPRHNCKNIWCNLPKKNLGFKVICK